MGERPDSSPLGPTQLSPAGESLGRPRRTASDHLPYEIAKPSSASTASAALRPLRAMTDPAGCASQALQAHLAGKTEHFEHEHRVRHENGRYRRVLCRGVAVRQVAAGAADRLGQHDVGRQLAPAALQVAEDAAHVRVFDAAGEPELRKQPMAAWRDRAFATEAERRLIARWFKGGAFVPLRAAGDCVPA